MSKQKESTLAVKEIIDSTKPLVKEFIDHDKEIINYLLLHLPHVPYAIPKFYKISSAKDKSTCRYRVNWYVSQYIASSVFVEVMTKSNTFSHRELTDNSSKKQL